MTSETFASTTNESRACLRCWSAVRSQAVAEERRPHSRQTSPVRLWLGLWRIACSCGSRGRTVRVVEQFGRRQKVELFDRWRRGRGRDRRRLRPRRLRVRSCGWARVCCVRVPVARGRRESRNYTVTTTCTDWCGPLMTEAMEIPWVQGVLVI